MKLVHKNQNITICDSLGKAHHFFNRGIGLIGKKSLDINQGLWIRPCKSVHTFFMSFNICVLYLNPQFKVLHITPNLKPWRLGPWVSGAQSVIELHPANPQLNHIKIGDSLDVIS